jgi:aspartate racemase
MRTIGIIGGIAPESTIDYYRRLLAGYRERQPDGSQPAIIINSIDLKKMLGMIGGGQLEEVTDYLASEVERLARAGAEVGALASNTPHVVFSAIARQSPIPLVSIVECTCAKAKSLRLKRLGLFGTRFTMQGRFYPDVFSREGLVAIAPPAQEQDYIHDKYMNELVAGKFLPETRERMLAMAATMQERGDSGVDIGWDGVAAVVDGQLALGNPVPGYHGDSRGGDPGERIRRLNSQAGRMSDSAQCLLKANSDGSARFS